MASMDLGAPAVSLSLRNSRARVSSTSISQSSRGAKHLSSPKEHQGYLSCPTFFLRLSLLIFLVACLGVIYGSLTGSESSHHVASSSSDEVLVMYAFSSSNPQHIENLKFFLANGVSEDDGCEYLFIEKWDPPGSLGNELPDLPRNARYIHRQSQCFDWGTFGWALASESILSIQYDYYMFITADARGPYMPTYAKNSIHFKDALLGKIDDDVKLVGSTVSCVPSDSSPQLDGEGRRNPHLHGHLVATDQIGLQLLRDDGRVFACHQTPTDNKVFSDKGAAAVILKAGYNLDTLMTQYQDLDWRDQQNWECNNRKDPYDYLGTDIFTLNPLDIMFVNFPKHHQPTQDWPAVHASLLDMWYDATAREKPDVHANFITGKLDECKLARSLSMAALGAPCFDCEFYTASNPDMAGFQCDAAFQHFVNTGLFEGRQARLKCHVPPGLLLPYSPQLNEFNTLPQLTESQLATLELA